MLMHSFLFIVGLAVALLLTPAIRSIAIRFNFVDSPSKRKVHRVAIPRLGGIGIYISVFITIFSTMLLSDDVKSSIVKDPTFIWLAAGSTVAFLLGLCDDVRRLKPTIKFVVQATAATIAYWGGIGIFQIELPWGSVYSLGIFSLPVTVFWFLLVINAINLIDGLDGLAAGVSLFAALTLLVTSLLGTQLTVSFLLAALAGSCLGFLRYNFNPASIFMGDGGSYFLGYTLAALSILGSMKSQATVSILIPLLALGLPLLDTLLAPVRRFLLGKQLFQPDKSHIHHRLLKRGLSHRNAVLVLYGATIIFGATALIDVLAKNEYAGLILLFLVGVVFFGIRKLGYLEYLASDKIIGYFRDITDDIGLKRDRRTFLGRQKAIREAVSPDEMWDSIIDALQLIDVDYAEISLNGNGVNLNQPCSFTWHKSQEQQEGTQKIHNNTMSIVLPLVNHRNHGSLVIEKDVKRSPLCEFTLRRIEQLRRSIVDRLTQFESDAVQIQSGKLYCMPIKEIAIKGGDSRALNQSDIIESESQSERNRVIGLPN